MEEREAAVILPATPANIRVIAGIPLDVEINSRNRNRYLPKYRAAKEFLEIGGVCLGTECYTCKNLEVRMCDRYQELTEQGD